MDYATELRTAWDEFSNQVRDAIDFVFDQADDEVDTAEGVRNVARTVQRAIHANLENAQVTRPELGWTYPMKMGQDNPDGLYQVAPIDLRNTYRFSGNVGTVGYLGVTLMTFNFGDGDIDQLLTVNGDDLPTDDAGNFEVYFSSKPAAGANWYELPAKECRLMIRQFFSDWENEVPATLHIECLDSDISESPRVDAGELISRLRQAGQEILDMPPFWTAFARGHLDRNEVNTFAALVRGEEVTEGSSTALGGSVEQAYGQCWYRVEPGEALIYETAVPECAYWGVQLGDIWYQSLDYVNHQSSLNGAQAELDGGVFRAVISHEDPGIANWLDLAGSTQGCITYRWNQATAAPVPTLTLVPFAELAGQLPETTPRITPEQRSEALLRRRRGALARYRR